MGKSHSSTRQASRLSGLRSAFTRSKVLIALLRYAPCRTGWVFLGLRGHGDSQSCRSANRIYWPLYRSRSVPWDRGMVALPKKARVGRWHFRAGGSLGVFTLLMTALTGDRG